MDDENIPQREIVNQNPFQKQRNWFKANQDINIPKERTPRKPRRLPEVLSIQEFIQILNVTKDPEHRLAFKLGFLCGLRISEIVKLQKTDIDWGRRMIFIRAGKGKKDRYVPLPEPLKRDLRYLPFGIGVRALQIAFKKKAKKAGVQKDVHFHSLRHSSASYYLSKGMDIKEVQTLLGHADLSTTGIYLHINPTQVQSKMDEIWK